MKNITYCFDDIKPYLDADVDFNVFPYMIVLLDNSYRTDSFMAFPAETLSIINPNGYNEFMGFFIRDEAANTAVDVMSAPKKTLSPLDRKYFKRWGDISHHFKIPYRDVIVSISPWIRFKDHVKSSGRNTGIYRRNEVRISDNHILKTHKENFSEIENRCDDSNILIYDDTRKHSYMFDRKLSMNMSKDIDSNALIVNRIYTKPEVDPQSNIDLSSGRFYAHVLHTKSMETVKKYVKYFSKQHDLDVKVAMSERADDIVNKRLSMIKRFQNNIEVNVGEVQRPDALYEVTFDMYYVEDNTAIDGVLSYIKNNGLYSNLPNGHSATSKETVTVGLDNIQAINKLKIVPSWLECVTEIVASDVP